MGRDAAGDLARRYLLERMTDRQMAMLGDGSLRDLPGGVPGASPSTGHEGVSGEATPASRSPVRSSAVKASASRGARKTTERLERQLTDIDRQERELHDRMVASATDTQALAALTTELDTLNLDPPSRIRGVIGRG